jgi:hypothetical protein
MGISLVVFEHLQDLIDGVVSLAYTGHFFIVIFIINFN